VAHRFHLQFPPDPIMDRGDDRVDQFMMSVFMKSGLVFDERIQTFVEPGQNSRSDDYCPILFF
ncbi:hypothetical protein, partial [Methanocalculus taiwanensis]|uniref:hypothetical protein n=1 Tax=Methanocalculus taiwanensis TaxID=106207 RepID=UPI00210132A9